MPFVFLILRIGRIVIKDPLPGSSLLGGMVSRVVSIYD